MRFDLQQLQNPEISGVIFGWRSNHADVWFGSYACNARTWICCWVFKRKWFREVMIKIASFIIVGYGIYMAYLGYSAAIA